MVLPEKNHHADKKQNKESNGNNNDDTGNMEDAVDTADALNNWIVATSPF